jgi:hypothetical protein
VPLTQARLKELFRYESETGEFFWRVNKGTAKAGDRVECIDGHGYSIIGVDGRNYAGHRLAWIYMFGYFPKELDHKDRDRSNNRVANLRDATRSRNRANAKMKSNNQSGFKGVSQYGSSWRAYIGYNSKVIALGTFSTPEEAHAAYCRAGRELYGEFFFDGVGSVTASP